MKLKPRQIFGLGAIVVFGGILIFRLTQPSEREIMERRLASLPSVTVPQSALDFPPLDLTPPSVPPVPDLNLPAAPVGTETDYLTPGSQAARDDLYCDGALNAEFDTAIETATPDEASALLAAAQRLRGSGLARLRDEGASDGEDWAFFTQAYAALTEADHAAGRLRISIADCRAREAALPADSPPP